MTKRKNAIVLGNGLVGLTCARVLLLGGWQVTVVKSPKTMVRTIALQEQTKHILDKIWACDVSSICNSRIITGRRIKWAERETEKTNEISGLCIEVSNMAQALEDRLKTSESIEFCETLQSSQEPGVFVFDALEGDGQKGSSVSFGNRVMHIWQRIEVEQNVSNRLEIYSGKGFWLIGLPRPQEDGASQSMSLQLALPSSEIDHHEILNRVLNEPDLTSSQRHLFTPMIEECLDTTSSTISIAPSIRLETGLDLPFSLGSRAMKFDPICGDGTGQGIKSAILAVAATNSESRFGRGTVRSHMRIRMLGTFCAHLQNCISYYQTIASSLSWHSEIEHMQDGLVWLNSNKKPEDVPSLSLKVPIEMKEWACGPSLIIA